MTKKSDELFVTGVLSYLASTFRGLEYRQGVGGNISAKTDETMAVKASGYTFMDMAPRRGHVSVDYRAIRALYDLESTVSEDEARERILAVTSAEDGKRPSIETGFHALLGNCVVHTHPLYLNAILASASREKILREVYPDVQYTLIPYTKPGHELTKAIAQAMAQQKECRRHAEDVYFLENHGLIVSGDMPIDATFMTEEICEHAKTYVLRNSGLREPVYEGIIPYQRGELCGHLGIQVPSADTKHELVFPDAVVFMHGLTSGQFSVAEGRILYPVNMSEEAARNIDEVLFAHAFIKEAADRLGGTVPLTLSEQAALLDMPEEKYRQGLLGMNGGKH